MSFVATFAIEVRDALPDPVQVAGWWYLLHNVADFAKEVAAYSVCRAGSSATRPRGDLSRGLSNGSAISSLARSQSWVRQGM
jgi:hypothetical protein